MNYVVVYARLVERARTRVISEFTERHHVIPRCMGGSNRADNIVRLTPEEHYLAHKLLARMRPDNPRVVFALYSMCLNPNGQCPNNKLFGWMRRAAAEAVCKLKTGVPRDREMMERIWEATRGRKATSEQVAKMKAALKGVPHTAEHNAAVSVANKGRKSPMEGRQHTAETRAKQSLAAQGRTHTPETVAKLTAGHAASTQEQRSARAHKAWQTKRAKANDLFSQPQP